MNSVPTLVIVVLLLCSLAAATGVSTAEGTHDAQRGVACETPDDGATTATVASNGTALIASFDGVATAFGAVGCSQPE